MGEIAFEFREPWFGWVAFEVDWIARARPHAGIMNYRSESVRVQHSFFDPCMVVCEWYWQFCFKRLYYMCGRMELQVQSIQ